MNVQNTDAFETGELYVFTGNNHTPRLWGIFGGTDDTGRILLEAASEDFNLFSMNISLPECYEQADLSTRRDLRDFAYNLGSQQL